MLFRMSLYDKSEILVLSVIQLKALIFCFAFHAFHLLFTETDREDYKLIYEDSQLDASLSDTHTDKNLQESRKNFPDIQHALSGTFKPTTFLARAGR